MKKIKLDNKGFTLVEILVAAGLMGILAVVMMNIFKQQTFSQKKTEAGFELSTLQQSINTTLLNAQACTNTLTVIPNIAVPNLTLTQIRDQANNVQFQTGVSYGNLVEIETIRLVNVVYPTASVPTKRYGTLDIQFNFKKTSKVLENTNINSRTNFKVNIETDLAGRVTNCYSALENAVDTAKVESCQAIGGTFDTATNKCVLPPYTAGPGSDTDATSTKFLEDYMANFIVNVLDPRYVNVGGDTMTGSLVMNNAGIAINNSALNLNNSNIVQIGTGYMSTQQYLTISDRRLKKSIKDISSAKLQKLDQLKTHEFRWRNDNRLDYGFIAQEIEKIFPELVVTNPDTGYKAVQYVSLVPIMLQQVQLLKEENEALRAENKKMREDIEKIKKHLDL